MDEPLTGVTLTREERLLAVLQATYPGWEIIYQPGKDGELPWLARRRTPPSEAQRRAGIRELVYRTTGEALGSAVAGMVEIAHYVH
ncbi:hypothetical protein [Microtetraspora niveoalba]|uniref:hypothetical protein n=1 Tax=Microtetraspora niveoalba TaxID=46175 RepID=UPI00082F5A62|nr:hypothetical protein [Microtetraspora niveoalba]